MVKKSLIISLIIGLVVGFAVLTSFSRVDFFKDFFNQFLKPAATTTPSVISPAPQILYESKVSYEEAIIDAVEKTAPAVVSIIVSKDLPVLEKCPYDPFSDLPEEFRQFFGPFEFYQTCPKGTKKQEIGGGTGFIISKEGLILSNKHVVGDKEASYTVLTNDGNKYEAKILALDPIQDLAIIKISAPGLNLPVVKLGNSDGLRLGQTTIAIGNALGEFRNTVSVGIVSGLARKLTASGGDFEEVIEGAIQTDAAINRGNSGGPLLNLSGEVIGINTAIAMGAQNIGFAIPINKAKRAIESVKATGKITTPFLGVRYYLITKEMAEREKLPVKNGVLVRGTEEGPGVIPDSPASKAGIQAEDIILEIDEQKIDENNTLASLILKYKVGDTIELKILRAGKEIELKATLEERK
jgi:S1-C subfamily serine protease